MLSQHLCLSPTDSRYSHTIDTIDLNAVPFELSYADFLHLCANLDQCHSNAVDSSPGLSDPLCLLDINTADSLLAIHSLQLSLYADTVSIGSIPVSPLLSDDEILALVLHDLGPAQ